MSIAVGALNLVSLSDALTERIPVSGPGDPGVLLSTLGFAVNKITRVAVEYASATNQASVIQAAITAATSGDALYFGQGVVKIETSITQTTKKLHWIGSGTIFRTISNIAILNIAGASTNYSTITGIQFEGNDTGASQKGIVIGCNGFRIINCNGLDLNASFIDASATAVSPYDIGQVSNCRATSCATLGFNCNGEYVTYSNCSATTCGTGWSLSKGNITLSGCSGSGNTTGLIVTGGDGTNNAHSTVLGGQWNHNTTSINYDDVEETGSNPLSVMFVGLQIFNGTLLINDDLPFFSACEISAGTITVSNCSRALFIGCRIHGTPTVNGTSTANIVFQNCYKNDGSLYP